MKSEFKVIIFTLAVLVGWSAAWMVNAGGDKNRTANPVIDSDGNVVGIVTPANCTMLVDMTSGTSGWFCVPYDVNDD